MIIRIHSGSRGPAEDLYPLDFKQSLKEMEMIEAMTKALNPGRQASEALSILQNGESRSAIMWTGFRRVATQNP